MTQELIELLQPCPVPWCLGEADADWYAVGEQDRPYWVRCKACGCKTPRQYATVAEAIAAWNTRDQFQSARIAELEGLLREILEWREKGETRLLELQALMDGAYSEIRKALGPNASFAHSVNSAILRISGPLAQIGFAIDRASLTKDSTSG